MSRARDYPSAVMSEPRPHFVLVPPDAQGQKSIIILRDDPAAREIEALGKVATEAERFLARVPEGVDVTLLRAAILNLASLRPKPSSP